MPAANGAEAIKSRIPSKTTAREKNKWQTGGAGVIVGARIMKIGGCLDVKDTSPHRSLFLVYASMTYHFLILISTWWVGRGHRAGATFGIPGRLLMLRGGRNRDGIDRTGITITTEIGHDSHKCQRRWGSRALTCSCPVVVHRYPMPKRRWHLFHYDLRWYLWWKQPRRVFRGLRPNESISLNGFASHRPISSLTVRPSSFGPHEAE